MHQTAKIIKPKLGLLKLVKQPGNVRLAYERIHFAFETTALLARVLTQITWYAYAHRSHILVAME